MCIFSNPVLINIILILCRPHALEYHTMIILSLDFIFTVLV